MPREVSFTSKLAYERILAAKMLPPARLRTYDLLYREGPLTARQVDDTLGRDYHKRLPELLEQGVACQSGTISCPVTRQEVFLWDVTDRLPVPLKRPRPETSTLTGREKALAEIRKHIPEKKRSPELCQLLAELETQPPEPDDEDLEAMFRP
jgi:hypothetical protein